MPESHNRVIEVLLLPLLLSSFRYPLRLPASSIPNHRTVSPQSTRTKLTLTVRSLQLNVRPSQNLESPRHRGRGSCLNPLLS